MGKARRRSSRGKAAKREQKSSHTAQRSLDKEAAIAVCALSEDFTAENIAQSNRNQSSEYLPQRRKVRNRKKTPNLAFLEPGREAILFPRPL